MIQCNYHIKCRKPSVVSVEKEVQKCMIVDVTIPGDKVVCAKETEKLDKCQGLKIDIKKLRSLKMIEAVPVVPQLFMKGHGLPHTSLRSSLGIQLQNDRICSYFKLALRL